MKNPSFVSALFVRKDSIYKKLGIDCWDIERNALNFNGINPVICHPPCRSWGRLRHLSNASQDEHDLSFFAIEIIRKNGGVLEHPRSSKLFPEFLPLPGSFDSFGGFSISLDQFVFGHPCRKNSLIYICGTKPNLLPALPLNYDAIKFTIGTSNKSRDNFKKELPKNDRDKTPILFAKFLINIASLCSINQMYQKNFLVNFDLLNEL